MVPPGPLTTLHNMVWRATKKVRNAEGGHSPQHRESIPSTFSRTSASGVASAPRVFGALSRHLTRRRPLLWHDRETVPQHKVSRPCYNSDLRQSRDRSDYRKSLL